MTGPSIVEQYWTGVSSQLQVEADVFNRLIGHNGEMGRANELALAQLVTSLFPSSLGVGTGLVIDSHGSRSRQQDLIVYDRASQPQVMAHSTQLLFPIETVRAVVEVKTTVSTTAIEEAACNFESVRGLVPAGDHKTPLTAFFGYRAASNPSARTKELNALAAVRRPDIACVLDPGLVSSAGGAELGMGLVPLHDLDSDGVRLSRRWVPAPPEGRRVVRGNTSYPVSRLAQGSERLVFEPGRALLLFAELLLNGLSARAGINSAWLGHYLPDVARETVIPEDA